MLFSSQGLNLGNLVNPVMIGHSYQIEMFRSKIFNELLSRPTSITISGVHMEVNCSVGGKDQIRGQTSQDELLFLDRERSLLFVVVIMVPHETVRRHIQSTNKFLP